MRRSIAACLLTASVALLNSESLAQSRPADTAAEPNLETAKTLFHQGVEAFEQKDYERALRLFRRSRTAFPSSRNTLNAAVCLDRLKRYDEALEMYEETLSRFQAELDDTDRAAIRHALAVLRDRVGTLWISSNVAGQVVVDGQMRGRLPLESPIPLLPGHYQVRVIKEGYITFEATPTIAAKTTVRLDARLEPLATSGGLRVEDPDFAQSEVAVDGAIVGHSPWEGMLAPGDHVVQTRTSDRASGLVRATIVQGQTALLRLASLPGGRPVVLEADPFSGYLLLDGIALGKGRWQGMLPAGRHTLLAREEGYYPGQVSFALRSDRRADERIVVRLAADPSHPRWPKKPQGQIWVQGLAGVAFGSSLRSGPERYCPSQCSDSSPVAGYLAGVRAGYELPIRVSPEVTVGFLSVTRTVDRRLQARFPADSQAYAVDYSLRDEIHSKGPLLGAGASLRTQLSKKWALRTRLTLGLIFAQTTDTITGTATAAGGASEVRIPGGNEAVSSRVPFLQSELGAEYASGPWRLTGALATFFLPAQGDDFPRSAIVVPGSCAASNPSAPSCAPAYNLIGSERSFGPTTLLLPQIQIMYTF